MCVVESTNTQRCCCSCCCLFVCSFLLLFLDKLSVLIDIRHCYALMNGWMCSSTRWKDGVERRRRKKEQNNQPNSPIPLLIESVKNESKSHCTIIIMMSHYLEMQIYGSKGANTEYLPHNGKFLSKMTVTTVCITLYMDFKLMSIYDVIRFLHFNDVLLLSSTSSCDSDIIFINQ